MFAYLLYLLLAQNILEPNGTNNYQSTTTHSTSLQIVQSFKDENSIQHTVQKDEGSKMSKCSHYVRVRWRYFSYRTKTSHKISISTSDENITLGLVFRTHAP